MVKSPDAKRVHINVEGMTTMRDTMRDTIQDIQHNQMDIAIRVHKFGSNTNQSFGIHMPDIKSPSSFRSNTNLGQN